MNFINRIGLGTAQFGLDYGAINPKIKVSENEVCNILKETLTNGINIVDTAVAYGTSEEVIGKFIKKNETSFNIISKLPFCETTEIEQTINNSLRKLNVDRLYGYLFHDFNLYRERPETWMAITRIKKSGKIKKIGFSLYYTKDLERLIKDDIEIDMLQIPYNIFDRRFEKYFKIIKERNIELHVRSVFLRGLFFINPNKLNNFFARILDRLVTLNEISVANNISIVEICLQFVMSNKYIDKAIVGVHTVDQLKEIICYFEKKEKIKNLSKKLSLLRVDDEEILLPFKWRDN